MQKKIIKINVMKSEMDNLCFSFGKFSILQLDFYGVFKKNCQRFSLKKPTTSVKDSNNCQMSVDNDITLRRILELPNNLDK